MKKEVESVRPVRPKNSSEGGSFFRVRIRDLNGFCDDCKLGCEKLVDENASGFVGVRIPKGADSSKCPYSSF